MKRDMMKTAQSVILPDHYCITLEETETLRDLEQHEGTEGLFNAIMIAFRYGFVLGERYEKKRQSDARKAKQNR